MKGRDLLRSLGMKAYIERNKGQLDQRGCGYHIYVDGDVFRARQILKDHHIKIMDGYKGASG
jgi:hypothetical protein